MSTKRPPDIWIGARKLNYFESTLLRKLVAKELKYFRRRMEEAAHLLDLLEGRCKEGEVPAEHEVEEHVAPIAVDDRANVPDSVPVEDDLSYPDALIRECTE